MMTIAVYRIDPETGQRATVREEHRVGAGETLSPLPAHSRYPLCQCPQAPDCHEREWQVNR